MHFLTKKVHKKFQNPGDLARSETVTQPSFAYGLSSQSLLSKKTYDWLRDAKRPVGWNTETVLLDLVHRSVIEFHFMFSIFCNFHSILILVYLQHGQNKSEFPD